MRFHLIFGITSVCLLIAMIGFLVLPYTRSDIANSEPKIEATEELEESAEFSFPGGMRSLKDNFRFVALYGTPDAPTLGALGTQSLDDTITRVRVLAENHKPYSAEPIYPTLEIITTVASSSPTANGDYSNELALEKLKPWIEAAQENNCYVVLDLQPGRSDFLTQAKAYESLLRYPHVGLALDPEWRIGADQTPLNLVGSVDASEINQVSDWLSKLIKEHELPQKLLVMHQFKRAMISNREQINTDHPELSMIIQMDGHGSQPVKQTTWNVLHQGSPAGINFGWKNFYNRDSPMLSPEQTMMISPKPWFVSYQ